jgi:hypothetical protein
MGIFSDFSAGSNRLRVADHRHVQHMHEQGSAAGHVTHLRGVSLHWAGEHKSAEPEFPYAGIRRKFAERLPAWTGVAQADPLQPPNQTTGNSAPPSLGDLGFPAAETQPNPQEQARLDKRSHMLKIHQRLGLITTVPLIATVASGAFAGGKEHQLYFTRCSCGFRLGYRRLVFHNRLLLDLCAQNTRNPNTWPDPTS